MRDPTHLRAALLISVLLYSGMAEAAQSAKLPTVRLIATGGTISNRPGGRLTAEELVELIPSLERYAQIEVERFANIPSSELTLEQWLSLSRRVNQLFEERPDLDGIVVTSGTDTLEETAYFLHLTVRHAKPVVIVGSMRRPASHGYDGAANLLQGFRVAADPASRGRGVLVALNNEINSAREVTKTDTQRLQTFSSRSYGVLGVVDTDRVVYYRRSDRRHTERSEFDVFRIGRLPRVDILLSYQGAQGDLVRAAADAGASGLVLAGAGAGSISNLQRDAVQALLDRGLTIVLTSRTGGGRVTPGLTRPEGALNPKAERHRPNRIGGEDMSPVKARILLMLALTKTRDGKEIQRMFQEY